MNIYTRNQEEGKHAFLTAPVYFWNLFAFTEIVWMNTVKTIHVIECSCPGLGCFSLEEANIIPSVSKKEIKPLKVIFCESLLADIMSHSISALL